MEWIFILAVLGLVGWLVIRGTKSSSTSRATAESVPPSHIDYEESIARYIAGQREQPSPKDVAFAQSIVQQYGLGGGDRLLKIRETVTREDRSHENLLRALQDQDAGVCRWAADYAGERRITETVPYLIALLSRREQNFMYARKAAARALGEIGDATALDKLQEALQKEEVPGVRDSMGDAIIKVQQHGKQSSPPL